VIGGNVMTSVPYGFDLLIVRGWRPPHGWWRLPSIRHYRESATFGFQQIAVGIASAASGAVEAAMLPATIGFAAIGLLGRARALYSATAGRLGTILVETVYPFLPREWKNRESYGRHAAMFVQVTFFITVPAAALLGLEGRHLSRVLYGQKWMAMDPLIWPGALAGVATGVFATCAGILLAANRLRISLTIEVVMSAVTIAALAAAWTTHDVISYGWTLSVAEMCAAGVALWLVSPLIAAGWPRRAVLPPVFASLAGTAAVLVSRVAVPPSTPVWHVIETTTVFASVSVLTCRFAFPATFSALVRLLPGQHVLPAWVAGDAARA
jgi:O-antigen/teichoic acid export membrane protein